MEREIRLDKSLLMKSFGSKKPFVGSIVPPLGCGLVLVLDGNDWRLLMRVALLLLLLVEVLCEALLLCAIICCCKPNGWNCCGELYVERFNCCWSERVVRWFDRSDVCNDGVYVLVGSDVVVSVVVSRFGTDRPS